MSAPTTGHPRSTRWTRVRVSMVLVALAAVTAGTSLAFGAWGDDPALSGSHGNGSITFGYPVPRVGDTFYLLGPQPRNESGSPIVIVGVSATVRPAGARNVGWKLVRVADGTITGFDPSAGDDEWAAHIVPGPKPVQTIAPHSWATGTALYLAFVLDRTGAYKTDRVTVTYRQHGRLRHAHYSVGYRFGTADVTPLP